MSLLDQILGDASKAVEDAWGAVTTTGVPAVLAGVEEYGADLLRGLAQDHRQEATANAQVLMQGTGANAGGVMGAIQDAFQGIGQSAALKNYGPYIIAGIVVVGVSAVFVFGRKK